MVLTAFLLCAHEILVKYFLAFESALKQRCKICYCPPNIFVLMKMLCAKFLSFLMNAKWKTALSNFLRTNYQVRKRGFRYHTIAFYQNSLKDVILPSATECSQTLVTVILKFLLRKLPAFMALSTFKHKSKILKQKLTLLG